MMVSTLPWYWAEGQNIEPYILYSMPILIWYICRAFARRIIIQGESSQAWGWSTSNTSLYIYSGIMSKFDKLLHALSLYTL